MNDPTMNDPAMNDPAINDSNATKAYPDLEIYIKRVEPKIILNWLKNRLEEEGSTLIGTEVKSSTLLCTFRKNECNTECAIVDKAAKGGFVSIWFKENQTPWLTDRDLALEAFDFFQQEVRCSTGPWEDDTSQNISESSDDKSDDKDGWIRFTDEGEKIVNWLT